MLGASRGPKTPAQKIWACVIWGVTAAQSRGTAFKLFGYRIMKTIKQWMIMGVLFGLAGCVTQSTYLKQVQTSDQLKAQNTTLEFEKKALTGQVMTLEQKRMALEANLTATEKQNNDLLTTLETKKGELNQRLADLTRANRNLDQKLRDTEIAKETEISKLKATYDQLVGNLKEQINTGQIQITQLAGRLSVNMVDKILFNSGEASVKPGGEKVLLQVGAALKNVQDKAIRVEGHTDNVPIAESLRLRFPSNWELSTARATAVVRYLQDKAGIAPDHLIAAGYGEHRPIAPNTTPEGRAQNRRIEIVLVPVESVAVSTSPAK
jgi:chemotaxis protein MotB